MSDRSAARLLVLTAFLVTSAACATGEDTLDARGRAHGAPEPVGSRAIVLPPLLSSGAVLQRDDEVELWGIAPAGATIRIDLSWSDADPRVRVDDDGRFSVQVATGPAGGPHRVTLSSDAAETVVLEDLLFGEVWLASGQSNMEWSIAAAQWNRSSPAAYRAHVANASDDELRFFQVPRRVAFEPQELCVGAWRAATPDTVPDFSAVGLHFARHLRAELDVPVGVLWSSWGGTVAQAWTSGEALRGRFDGFFDDALARIDAELAESGSVGEALEERQAAWWERLERTDPGLAAGWSDAAFDAGDWREVEVPGDPDPTFDGTLWLRREVEIPADWAGRELALELGAVDDMDQVWFDGEAIGATRAWGLWNEPRRYRVPAKLVRGGRASLVVQCVDTGGGAGLHGGARRSLHPVGARANGSASNGIDPNGIDLNGAWRYRRGAPLADLGAFPTESWFGQNHPTALFNGMIAPLVRTRVRGAIWYQGESNARRAELYAELFPAMIEDWRGRFRADGDDEPLPFYFVQIAPYRVPEPRDAWTELRLAQASVVPGATGVPERFHHAALEHTGMVVISDVGNPTDIHPRRKQPVGERLANWALADTYAAALPESDPRAERWRALPHHSPRAIVAERADELVRVRFEYEGTRDELTTADGAAPTHFELAGADGVFHPATAELVELRGAAGGQAVRLISTAVPEPSWVRFSWASDAEPNLRTRSGLPIGPFVLSVE